jgi:hypothetical protein
MATTSRLAIVATLRLNFISAPMGMYSQPDLRLSAEVNADPLRIGLSRSTQMAVLAKIRANMTECSSFVAAVHEISGQLLGSIGRHAGCRLQGPRGCNMKGFPRGDELV